MPMCYGTGVTFLRLDIKILDRDRLVLRPVDAHVSLLTAEARPSQAGYLVVPIAGLWPRLVGYSKCQRAIARN